MLKLHTFSFFIALTAKTALLSSYVFSPEMIRCAYGGEPVDQKFADTACTEPAQTNYPKAVYQDNKRSTGLRKLVEKRTNTSKQKNLIQALIAQENKEKAAQLAQKEAQANATLLKNKTFYDPSLDDQILLESIAKKQSTAHQKVFRASTAAPNNSKS
jgi:hypothetical protein